MQLTHTLLFFRWPYLNVQDKNICYVSFFMTVFPCMCQLLGNTLNLPSKKLFFFCFVPPSITKRNTSGSTSCWDFSHQLSSLLCKYRHGWIKMLLGFTDTCCTTAFDFLIIPSMLKWKLKETKKLFLDPIKQDGSTEDKKPWEKTGINLSQPVNVCLCECVVMRVGVCVNACVH